MPDLPLGTMFSFFWKETPKAVSESLHGMLNNTPGLRLSSGSGSTDILTNANLIEFLNMGVASKQHFLPNARGKITRIFEMTQSWCEFRTHNDLHGMSYCDPEPLSDKAWQRIEHNLSPNNRALGDCENTEVLDRLARLLLTARKDWLMENMDKICEVPGQKMIARIHSCLLVLRKRKMLGYKMNVDEKDNWLDFITCYEEVDNASRNCEERYG